MRRLALAAILAVAAAAAADTVQHMSPQRPAVGKQRPPIGRQQAAQNPPPAPSGTCLCFTAEYFTYLQTLCAVPLTVSCPDAPSKYSLQFFCAPGGPVANLGYFAAIQGSGNCTKTEIDPGSGDPVTTTLAVTAPQAAVCDYTIATAAYYPGTCPH